MQSTESFVTYLLGIILILVFSFVVRFVRTKEDVAPEKGWVYVQYGLHVLFFGFILALTERLPLFYGIPFLGDTLFQPILEFSLDILGMAIIAYGMWTWLPSMIALRRTEKLQRAERDMAMFYLDLMSHDIRNHLQIISSALALLDETSEDRLAGHVVDTAMQAIAQCTDIIRKISVTDILLEVSLVERRLDHVLSDVVNVFDYHGVDLSLELETNRINAVVKADEFLEHLIQSLLENAVKHNPKEKKRILVELIEGDVMYCIDIADNGPGIPDEKKAYLLDPSRRFGGVGLHQCKHIIDKYEGTIEILDRVEDDSSQGARVRVCFPKIID